MRIDWKDHSTELPRVIDWSDPTHVPLMVAEVIRDCGNLADCFPDKDLDQLYKTAIDNLRHGKRLVRDMIEDHLYDMARNGGWTDELYERGTKEYPRTR